MKKSIQAHQLATKFKISRRTAYRHLRNGTVPSDNRRIGRDGKTYPVSHPDTFPRSQISTALMIARQALNRAAKKASVDGASIFDIGELTDVINLAKEIQKKWCRSSERNRPQ